MKKIFITLLVIFMVLTAFCLRVSSLWLPKWLGDQTHYIALAMKLDHFGIDGYNLRGIDAVPIMLNQELDWRLVKVQPAEGEGNMLNILKRVGYDYYDQPLFWKAPLLPYLIMYSHRVFTKDNHPYVGVQTNLSYSVKYLRPRPFLVTQFYLAIWPLFFSTLTILLIFLLGRKMFSSTVGLIASFIMACNAISIWISYKVWTENLLVFFMVLCTYVFVLAKEKKNIWLYIVSGFCCGLAVLSKQTAAIILMPICFLAIVNKDKKIFAFILTLVLITLPWFLQVFKVYGNPFFIPQLRNQASADNTMWSTILDSRPLPVILYSVGTIYLCPLFIFLFMTLKDLVRQFKGLIKRVQDKYYVTFLWVWVLSVFIFCVFITGREHRYFFPAYPAIAVLSGLGLEKFAGKLKKRIKPASLTYILIGLLIIAGCFWSASIGLHGGLKARLMLRVPF